MRAEVVEADAVEVVRYWPRESYVAYRDGPSSWGGPRRRPVPNAISDEEFGRRMSTDLVGDQPSAVFGAAADRAVAAFGQPGALERIVTLPFGTMPASTRTSRSSTSPCTPSTWRATGQSAAFDPDVLQAGRDAAQAMLGADMRATGMFAAAQPCADDAPLADRLMAYTGRSV